MILGANIARINPNNASDKTVSVQGEGKSSLVPDIYTFSVSANETGSTTKAVNEALALKINAAQEAVSYTHLDVYKRQVYTFLCILTCNFPIIA